jgi:predicted flap endonuclease-1-like 5' DNA nuclease
LWLVRSVSNMRSLVYFLLGLILGYWINEYLRSDSNTRTQTQASEPVRVAREAAKPPALPTPDPLVEIKGIGPSFEQALNALGIYSFAQLAAQDADDLAIRMNVRVTAERIRRERWIEQARERSQA